jgi:hypothetical protein
VIFVLFLTYALGVATYALWRGGQPERLVASSFLIAILASRLGGASPLSNGLYLWVFIVDLVLALVLFRVALTAHRLWPMPVAGMQLLSAAGHLLRLSDPTMLPALYWVGRAVWAYPMFALLAVGTLRHRNRVKQAGREPDWTFPLFGRRAARAAAAPDMRP